MWGGEVDAPMDEDEALLKHLIKRLFELYWLDLWSASCVTVSNYCITALL